MSRSGYQRRQAAKRNFIREQQKHAIPEWCVIRFRPEFTASKKTLLGPDKVRVARLMGEVISDLPRTPLRNLVPDIEDLIVRAALASGWRDTDIFADGEIDFYVRPYKRRELMGDAHPLRVVNLFIWKNQGSLEILNTVAHELRHAGQFHRQQHYKPHPNPEVNWYQPAEIDARAFAAMVVRDLAPELPASQIARYVWLDRITENDKPVWVVRRGLTGTIVKGGKHRSYEEASDFMRTLGSIA